MSSVPTIEQLLDDYARGDLDDDDLRQWFVLDEDLSGPFAPAVRPTADVRSGRSARGIGSGLTAALNVASRRRRRSIFDRRRGASFTGLTVISEGDSWFQLPVLVKDTIDHLIEDPDLAILSLGAAGDTIGSMVERGELVRETRRHRPDAVLISAGGNDVLADGGLESRLRDAGSSNTAGHWIDPFFYSTLEQVLSSYVRQRGCMFTATTTRVPSQKGAGLGVRLPDVESPVARSRDRSSR